MGSEGVSVQPEGTAVQLLGGLSVRLRGMDVTPAVGGRVGQLAFAYLVINRDRAIRRDELAAAIWEENAPADPDAALRVVVSRLRKGLGPEALVGRSEIRLVLPEPVEVDLECLLDSGDPTAQAPVDARELLPGLESDWITGERAKLADIRVGRLLGAGQEALQRGDLDTAETAARQLVSIAPFRESGHRLLMETLSGRGEIAEALHSYENYRLLLREELGTAPGRELAALHTSLLAADEQAQRPTGATSDHLAVPAPAILSGRPRLAGREEELERLEQIRALAARSGPTHVLVGGEPGIGKTRLASELIGRAHRGGWNVLWGRCHEAALVPYEPFVEALRQYAAGLSSHQLAQLAHAAGTEFLALAPDLARRLPRASLAPVPDDPQARRYRLFESVAEVLALAAAARPLVVALEDLQWADQGTVLLLTHVLARAGSLPLLVVGTYRSTEVSAGHPLEGLPGGDRLILRGLTADQTAQIVDELAPGSPVAERVHADTEGNPLFVVESLRALDEDAGQTSVPGGIREVIDRRLRRLGRDASTVLGAGAVLGRDFSVGEVSRVTGMPQGRLLDAVDEAIATGLVEEVLDTRDRLTFTHALIQEVRYRQHSQPRRTALHQAAAEALRTVYGGDLAEHLADLATHLEAAARDQTSAREAVEALRQAGEQAAARQAFEDAVDWLERARALFELARPSEAGRCDVLLGLAEVLRATDRIAESRAVAADAAVYAREMVDGERLARAAFAFVGSHLVFKAGRPDEQDIDLLEEAVAAASEATVTKARLLARLCTAIYYSERFAEVPRVVQQALEVAGECGHEDALGWALYSQFWHCLAPERAPDAEATMRRLRPVARHTASLELTSESAMVEWYGLLRQGRPDLLGAEIARSREEIVRTGVPIYRWFADGISAMLAVTAGRFDEAEAMIGELARTGAAIDPHDLPRFAAIPMIQLRHHQGRLGELVEPLRGVVANNPGLPVWRGVLLEALVAGGEREEAAALLREMAVDGFAWLRRDVNWLWAITSTSSACVSLANESVADVLHGLLSGVPDQSVVCGPALGFLGTVSRFIAPLAALTGRRDEAERRFQGAITDLRRVGAGPLAEGSRAERDRLLHGAETSS